MKFKIFIELKGENQGYAKEFPGSKVVKNKTLLYVPVKNNIFNISNYPMGKFTVEVCESGGAKRLPDGTKMGVSQIVTDINGAPALPVYIRDRGHLINGEHVYFNIPLSMRLAIITGNTMGNIDKESITLNFIRGYDNLNNNKFKIRVKSHYAIGQQEREDLCKEFPNFKLAIDIARKKMNTLNCVDAYYYEMPDIVPKVYGKAIQGNGKVNHGNSH